MATADTQTGRIVADVRFTDEHTDHDIDNRWQIHTRTKRLQRYVGVTIEIHSTDNDTAIINLDFDTNVEGGSPCAADWVVTDLTQSIEEALCAGKPVDLPMKIGLPKPPAWLLCTTAVALAFLLTELQKVVYHF